MKLTTKFCTTLAILALAVGTASARPYASKIRLGTTEFTKGIGTSISYILNESADAVTIEVRDSGNTAVATFAGTTDQGVNSVVWDGTVDNAGGAAVADGAYTIVITSDKNNTAWAEITGQQSIPLYDPEGATYHTVFDGFSPTDVLVYPDTSSDFFGDLYATNSYAGGSFPAQAHIVLRADLEVADGADGYASRILKEPNLDGGGANSTLWWGDFDPENPDIIYKAGQSNPAFWYGDLNSSETLLSADPTFGQDPAYMGPYAPRSVVVVMEGTDKYAFFASANGIYKAPMTGNELSGDLVEVSTFSTTRYAMALDTDADGNLYFVSRYTDSTSGAGGMLLRWNNADTLGATPSLTEANAVWTVDAGPNMVNMHGPAISPEDGNVYVLFTNATSTNPDNGAYLVGNVSDATITKTLTTTDRVVDTTQIGGGWATNNVYGTVRCDSAGNLMIIDRSKEQIRMYTPGGASSIEIPAPTSQALTITPPANVDDWDQY